MSEAMAEWCLKEVKCVQERDGRIIAQLQKRVDSLEELCQPISEVHAKILVEMCNPIPCQQPHRPTEFADLTITERSRITSEVWNRMSARIDESIDKLREEIFAKLLDPLA